MRRLPLVLSVVVFALAGSGCATTPQSRIEKHRAAFDAFPAAVQEKVRAGRIDLGFTPEMVVIALGEPTRKLTRQTETGAAEVWVYHDNGPQFSFGFGMAGGGGRTAVGGGIDVTTGGYDSDEKVRVEFRDGKVAAVDYRRK